MQLNWAMQWCIMISNLYQDKTVLRRTRKRKYTMWRRLRLPAILERAIIMDTMSGKTKVSKDDFAAALRAHQAAVDATKSPQREAAEEVNATNSPQKNAVENNASHDGSLQLACDNQVSATRH
eukprot:scaffold7025_cov225-Skeletonema_marinoi.AAC.1